MLHSVELQPNPGLSDLFVLVSKSHKIQHTHTHTHTHSHTHTDTNTNKSETHKPGLHWNSDQLVFEDAT